MADIDKINGTDVGDIEKINGTDKGDIEKFNTGEVPASQSDPAWKEDYMSNMGLDE